MEFYPTYPTINMSGFKEFTWKDLYVELKEAIPRNTLEERGNEVYLCGYVDSNHAGEKGKRGKGSRSGFHIFEHSANLVVL